MPNYLLGIRKPPISKDVLKKCPVRNVKPIHSVPMASKKRVVFFILPVFGLLLKDCQFEAKYVVQT